MKGGNVMDLVLLSKLNAEDSSEALEISQEEYNEALAEFESSRITEY